jgi:hypothetical protein
MERKGRKSRNAGSLLGSEKGRFRKRRKALDEPEARK